MGQTRQPAVRQRGFSVARCLWVGLLVALASGCGAGEQPQPDSAAGADVAGDVADAPTSCPHLDKAVALAVLTDASEDKTLPHKSTRIIELDGVDVGGAVHIDLVLTNEASGEVPRPLQVLGVTLNEPTGFLNCNVLMPDDTARPCDGAALGVAIAKHHNPAACGLSELRIQLTAKRFEGLVPREGTLRVALAGDTKRSDEPLTITFRTRLGQPKASLEPPLVVATEVTAGATATREVTLNNTGTSPLLVSHLGLSGEAEVVSVAVDGASLVAKGQVDGAALPVLGAPLTPWLSVAPGGQRTLTLTLHAPDTAQHEAQLWLQTNDTREAHPKGRHSVALLLNPPCPVAKAKVVGADAVVPGATVQLRGDTSDPGPGTTTAVYQWKVTTPGGTPQPLDPSTWASNPTFVARYVGEYSACLQIKNSLGVWSCVPSCTTVTVVPEQALYIELTWTTPADPVPWDTGNAAGSDLDLHLAHPLAQGPDIDCDGLADPWFSNPFDSFWFNPKPNWGATAKSTDDPKVVFDNTDGSGPEAIAMAEVGGVYAPGPYAIGVHYWNDHGFGDSYATVRVFVAGALIQTFGPVELEVLDLWHVGQLSWKSQTAVDPASVEACWQSGDPCDKVGGGTNKWQASGAPCVTHCYVNPAFTSTQSRAEASPCWKKP